MVTSTTATTATGTGVGVALWTAAVIPAAVATASLNLEYGPLIGLKSWRWTLIMTASAPVLAWNRPPVERTSSLLPQAPPHLSLVYLPLHPLLALETPPTGEQGRTGDLERSVVAGEGKLVDAAWRDYRSMVMVEGDQ